MSPEEAEYLDNENTQRNQEYQYILQQSREREKQEAAMRAQMTPHTPITLGKYGAPDPRRMPPELLAILQARAQQQSQQMPEQAPEPRFTSDMRNFPSFFLREEMQSVRNRARNGGNTSNGDSSGRVLSAFGELFGNRSSSAGDGKQRSACAILWGDRF